MNRNVLSLFLKVEMLSVSSVTSVGKLFQRDGPVVAKLRGPLVVALACPAQFGEQHRYETRERCMTFKQYFQLNSEAI